MNECHWGKKFEKQILEDLIFAKVANQLSEYEIYYKGLLQEFARVFITTGISEKVLKCY